MHFFSWVLPLHSRHRSSSWILCRLIHHLLSFLNIHHICLSVNIDLLFRVEPLSRTLLRLLLHRAHIVFMEAWNSYFGLNHVDLWTLNIISTKLPPLLSLSLSISISAAHKLTWSSDLMIRWFTWRAWLFLVKSVGFNSFLTFCWIRSCASLLNQSRLLGAASLNSLRGLMSRELTFLINIKMSLLKLWYPLLRTMSRIILLSLILLLHLSNILIVLRLHIDGLLWNKILWRIIWLIL